MTPRLRTWGLLGRLAVPRQVPQLLGSLQTVELMEAGIEQQRPVELLDGQRSDEI